MARQYTTPNGAFIHFLNTYRPVRSTNRSLYDEHSLRAAHKAKVKPFELEMSQIDQVINVLKADLPSHVLVSGVAGDGKTFLCRQLWHKLGGTEYDWDNNITLKIDIQTESGCKRKVLFIKDLTATKNNIDIEQANRILNLLVKERNNAEQVVVVACNHGQILNRLRCLTTPEGKTDQQSVLLANDIEDAFFSHQKYEIQGIFLLDLTKTRQDNLFRKVVKLMCLHERWKECQHCEQHLRCPILANRNAFFDVPVGQEINNDTAFSRLTQRTAELFRLLELEDVHFPIREQLSFVANAILGKKRNGSSKELSNTHVTECAQLLEGNLSSENCNIYINILGNNLSSQLRSSSRIFSSLSQFEIGSKSNSFMDALLMEGIPEEDAKTGSSFEEFLGQDFIASRQAYLNAAVVSPLTPEYIGFSEELQLARCKLFMQWEPQNFLRPEKAEDPNYDYWSLTAFPHAKKYLDRIAFFEDANSKSKKLDKDLFDGLSLIMTGQYNHLDSQLTITTQGAEVNAKAGNYKVASFENSRDYIALKSPSRNNSVPFIEFRASTSQEAFKFVLTPKRFETLMQLSEGFLPSSFSQECLAELLALKRSLIHLYQEEKMKTDDEEQKDREVIIRLFPSGEIVLTLED